jgi:hypothetical protein
LPVVIFSTWWPQREYAHQGRRRVLKQAIWRADFLAALGATVVSAKE